MQIGKFVHFHARFKELFSGHRLAGKTYRVLKVSKHKRYPQDLALLEDLETGIQHSVPRSYLEFFNPEAK